MYTSLQVFVARQHHRPSLAVSMALSLEVTIAMFIDTAMVAAARRSPMIPSPITLPRHLCTCWMRARRLLPWLALAGHGTLRCHLTGMQTKQP